VGAAEIQTLNSGFDQLICPAQAFHQNPHDLEGKVGRLLNQKLKTLLVEKRAGNPGALFFLTPWRSPQIVSVFAPCSLGREHSMR
jgi:hypothetical protein